MPRMRSFLLCCLLATVSIAAAPKPETGRARALATIARLGGTFRADSLAPGAPIVRVDLHASAVADSDLGDLAGLARLAGHEKLESVLTTGSRVTAGGQAALQKALPRVRFAE